MAAMLGRHPSPPTTLPSDPTSLSLNTNNPFRNSTSPEPSATSPVRRNPPLSASLERPMSRNPFLDPPSGSAPAPKSEQDAVAAKLADDIFKGPASAPSQGPSGPPPRGPPPPFRNGPNGPPRGHRPTRSGDLRDGPRAPMRPRPANGERPGAESPEKTRHRRNSDSSIMDKDKQEDDRRRRERRKEREARREKEGKPRDGKARPGRRTGGLDVIDKLDVTGIYGQGLFHHDGPFDACNPHRNRKNNVRAPMQAFPENSANNALGGGSQQRFDYDRFHGRGGEGFQDYASSGQDYTTGPARRDGGRDKQYLDKAATVVDSHGRGEQIHGIQSHGLGTSTFLEGAPAPRSAIQRRESENDMPPMQMGGPSLGRKKSLAMRIRGLSAPRRPGDRVVSPDGAIPNTPDSPPGATQSAGGPLRARPMGQERNPFFNNGNDHDDAYDKKGARIESEELKRTASSRDGPTSPRGANLMAPPLTRAVTTDSAPSGQGSGSFDREREERSGGGGGGFMSRMKSLKGRRTRPEIRA